MFHVSKYIYIAHTQKYKLWTIVGVGELSGRSPAYGMVGKKH